MDNWFFDYFFSCFLGCRRLLANFSPFTFSLLRLGGGVIFPAGVEFRRVGAGESPPCQCLAHFPRPFCGSEKKHSPQNCNRKRTKTPEFKPFWLKDAYRSLENVNTVRPPDSFTPPLSGSHSAHVYTNVLSITPYLIPIVCRTSQEVLSCVGNAPSQTALYRKIWSIFCTLTPVWLAI